MKKRPPRKPLDWSAIADVMLKSFRGQACTDAERRLCADAYRRSPAKYGRVNAHVRSEEVVRIRRTGCP